MRFREPVASVLIMGTNNEKITKDCQFWVFDKLSKELKSLSEE